MTGGATARQHLTIIWERTGVKPEQLSHDPPEALFYLWVYFCQLDSKRTSNGFGANPLLHSEIEAWCRMTHIELTTHELEIIDALDRKKLEFHARQSEKSK